LATSKKQGQRERKSAIFFSKGGIRSRDLENSFLLIEITLPVFSKLTKMLKTRNVLGSDHNSQPHTHTAVFCFLVLERFGFF
jgi:hypothetical protein